MSRTLRRYGFTAELLAGMFTDGNQIRVDIEGSYPYDAQLVNSYLEPDRQIVWLVMAHPTFEPVEEGDEIPTHTLMCCRPGKDE